jgi:hypothetical protein
MGQLLRAMAYDRDTEDSVPALEIRGTPLLWYHLDDGVMGGKSITNLSVKDDKALHMKGTIDTSSVGWASARASLPPEGLAPNTCSIQVQVTGDGKTYKMLLHDNNHESRLNKTPLWEADIPTRPGICETKTLPLSSFIPSFMGSQLDASERAKYPMNPASLTKIGFMLSMRLSDGSVNPPETYGTEKTFDFSMLVHSLKAVVESKE